MRRAKYSIAPPSFAMSGSSSAAPLGNSFGEIQVNVAALGIVLENAHNSGGITLFGPPAFLFGELSMSMTFLVWSSHSDRSINNLNHCLCRVSLVCCLYKLSCVYYTDFQQHRRKGARARTCFGVLLVSINLLYISTAVYIAALGWFVFSATSSYLKAADGLLSPHFNGSDHLARLQRVMDKQSWMITISLGANVGKDF